MTTNYMTVPAVTVEIERRNNGLLKARVIQQDSAGDVYGRNILAKKQVTRLETAERMAKETLWGIRVDLVKFTYVNC